MGWIEGSARCRAWSAVEAAIKRLPQRCRPKGWPHGQRPRRVGASLLGRRDGHCGREAEARWSQHRRWHHHGASHLLEWSRPHQEHGVRRAWWRCWLRACPGSQVQRDGPAKDPSRRRVKPLLLSTHTHLHHLYFILLPLQSPSPSTSSPLLPYTPRRLRHQLLSSLAPLQLLQPLWL